MSDYMYIGEDGSYGGGERITPLSVKEAKAWAENNLNYDQYVEIFGEPEE